MQTKNFTKDTSPQEIHNYVKKLINTIEKAQKNANFHNNELLNEALKKLHAILQKDKLNKRDYKLINICNEVKIPNKFFFNKEEYLLNLCYALKKYKATSKIVDFYCENGKTETAHYFGEIMDFTYGQLEYNHTYIQWLFPLKEYSEYNSSAPVLTDEDIKEIKEDPVAQRRLELAFVTMLNFYGFAYMNNEIVKTESFDRRVANWINKAGGINHNYLRITRILKSLSVLGRKDLSKLFYDTLVSLKDEYNIPEETWNYWNETQKIA